LRKLKHVFPVNINSQCNQESDEMEELELIKMAKQGDLNAFNELVLKYQDQVFNLARRILDNPDMAEDIAQDTFIQAFQKLHQFRGGSFRAWLLKIATNQCYDEMRAWKRQPHQQLELIDKEGTTNESPYWIKDPGPIPEELTEMSDLRKVLEFGLIQLPLEFRIVVTLVDVHQMEYKEVSRIAGIPLGTVKSRLARGRMQLGSFLQNTAKPYISEQNVSNMKMVTPLYQPE